MGEDTKKNGHRGISELTATLNHDLSWENTLTLLSCLLRSGKPDISALSGEALDLIVAQVETDKGSLQSILAAAQKMRPYKSPPQGFVCGNIFYECYDKSVMDQMMPVTLTEGKGRVESLGLRLPTPADLQRLSKAYKKLDAGDEVKELRMRVRGLLDVLTEEQDTIFTSYAWECSNNTLSVYKDAEILCEPDGEYILKNGVPCKVFGPPFPPTRILVDYFLGADSRYGGVELPTSGLALLTVKLDRDGVVRLASRKRALALGVKDVNP